MVRKFLVPPKSKRFSKNLETLLERKSPVSLNTVRSTESTGSRYLVIFEWAPRENMASIAALVSTLNVTSTQNDTFLDAAPPSRLRFHMSLILGNGKIHPNLIITSETY